GRPHVIFTDEASPVVADPALSCAAGLPPHGFARIIDITDETKPKIISKLMLEVHDPANCAITSTEKPDIPGGADGDYFSYSSHYCNVDHKDNPTMLACTYQAAGLRVFDIRNPYLPREIAYYKPPAQGTAFLPGSNIWGPNTNSTLDSSASFVRFRKVRANATHGRQMEIWFASSDNAFQIVRF